MRGHQYSSEATSWLVILGMSFSTLVSIGAKMQPQNVEVRKWESTRRKRKGFRR